MKDIKVGAEKMTRNRRKRIKQMGDSLLLSKHSIQLSALFLLLSGCFLFFFLDLFSSGKFDQRNQKTGKCNYEINFSGKSRVAKISSTNTSLSFFIIIICLIGHNTTIFLLDFATATVFGSVN